MKTGEEFENGISSLKCTYFESEPVTLELKDNEFITSITGTGKDYIQGIIMETNFYRKIKQGLKGKVDGKGGTDSPSKNGMGAQAASAMNTGLGKMDFMMDNSASGFNI